MCQWEIKVKVIKKRERERNGIQTIYNQLVLSYYSNSKIPTPIAHATIITHADVTVRDWYLIDSTFRGRIEVL